jgi:Holliday junction resolvasome RuvABC endonuclease subunit
MNTIIAIDPGETTGFVIMEKHNNEWKLAQFGQISIDETPNWYKRIIKVFNVDLVIIEDYKIRPDTAMAHVGQTLYTPKLIGILEYISCVILY